MSSIAKNFLVFEDTKCIASVNATTYEDNGSQLIFYRNESWFCTLQYIQPNDKEHIYTILEGHNAVGSINKAVVNR